MRQSDDNEEELQGEPVEPLSFREVLGGMVGFFGFVLLCCEADRLSEQVVVWAIGAALLLTAVYIWRT